MLSAIAFRSRTWVAGGLPLRALDPGNPAKRRRLDSTRPAAALQPRQQPQHGRSHPHFNSPPGPSSSPPVMPKAVEHAQPPPHNSPPHNGFSQPHSSRGPSSLSIPTIHPPTHVQPAPKNGPGHSLAHRTTPVVLAAPPRLPSLMQPHVQPKPSFCQLAKSPCNLPAAPPKANTGCKPQLQSDPTPQSHFLDPQSDRDPSAAPADPLRAPNISPPTGTSLPGNSSRTLLSSKAPSNAPAAHFSMPASHKSPNGCVSTDRGSGCKVSSHAPPGANEGTSPNRNALQPNNACLSKAPAKASAAPSTAPVGADLTRNGPSIQPCKVAAKASTTSVPAPTSLHNANASGPIGISPPKASSHAHLRSLPRQCARAPQPQIAVFPPGSVASPRTHSNAHAAPDKELPSLPCHLAAGTPHHKPRQHTGTVEGPGSRNLGKAEGPTHLAGRSAKPAPLLNAVQPFLRPTPQPSPAASPKTLSDSSRSSKWSLPLRDAFSGKLEGAADGARKGNTPGKGALSNEVADPAKAFSQWPGRPAFVTYSRASQADSPAQPKSSCAGPNGNAASDRRRSHVLDKTKPVPTTGPSKGVTAGKLKAASIPGPSTGKPQHKGPSPDRGAKQATPAPSLPSSKVQPSAAINVRAPVQPDAAPTGKPRHATGRGPSVSVPNAGITRLVAASSATPHVVPSALCTGNDPPKASSPAVGKSQSNGVIIGDNAGQPCSVPHAHGKGQPDVAAIGANSPKGLIPCVTTMSKGQPLDSTARQAARLGQPGSQAQKSGAPQVSNEKLPAAEPHASTTDAAPESIATGLIPEPEGSAEKAISGSKVAKPRSPKAAAHEAPTVGQPMTGSDPSQKPLRLSEERAGSAAAKPAVVPGEDLEGTQAGQARHTMKQSNCLAAVSIEVIDLAEDSDTPSESAPAR